MSGRGLRGASFGASDVPSVGDSDSIIDLIEKSKYYDDRDEDEAKDKDRNIENLLCFFNWLRAVFTYLSLSLLLPAIQCGSLDAAKSSLHFVKSSLDLATPFENYITTI